MDGLGATDAYLEFLRSKIRLADATGFDIDPDQVNPALKPHCRAIVPWALRGGRRAIFAAFGLHKTAMQIELSRQIGLHNSGLRLQVIPLGVRREFFREAEQRFKGDSQVQLKFIRSVSEIDDERTIYLTNYETIRDGKLDPSLFIAANLDEASILRSYGSKTFQEFLPLFDGVRFKFVATATPSPNRYKELIHYAGFLGVMDTGQALTRFFKRDSSKAGNLTLYPHKVDEFWLWVHSWAMFIQRPSDLGFSDDGYELPPLTVRYHEVKVDLADTKPENNGQHRLFRDGAIGLADEAKERRDTLPARIEKLKEILQQDPDSHRVIWHDLEAERHAIEKAVPGVVSVYGSQDLDLREQIVEDFCEGRTKDLAGKPVMLGSGTNMQRYCHKAAYLGVNHKFNDFIQSIYRLQRFGQAFPVELDIIYAETEREIVRDLQAKWRRDEEMRQRMSEIIKKYGLNHIPMQEALARTIGVERIEVKGEHFTVANNDCVLEARRLADNSVDLIITSIPFSNHYEYTPSYNDFGHTDDNPHFWRQMDFLTPELLRALKPGRVACIHVKDRILFGNVTGAGVPTVSPFHAETIFHYRRHGFDYMGMITINTDVVRENNQTYRLGWSEQCKDGTKMGVGSPEYVILLHKPQSDRSRGYADEPVQKDKAAYSRARWQVDAHAFWRSSGDRLLTAEEMAAYGPAKLAKIFTDYSLQNVYDHEFHVRIGEELDARGALPSTFMSLAPGAHHPDIWHDVNRMLTLNGEQSKRAVEQHVCPLQFDIVDRLVRRFSNADELVFDPFCGLGTVPLRAMKLGRRGAGSELSASYFFDSVHYLDAAEREMAVPTLFDFESGEAA
ncbi:MAG: DNA methylase N-4 [Rhodospirillaceae bacterium]|nr:MAG: DNA methylase N-4 [Rhodospirillaceae bacterium]